MSVTALRPIPRPVPWTLGRRPLTWPTTEPAPLTVRIEITLDGESRHRDAAEVLDTLQRLANRLGPGRVTVRPDIGGEAGPQLSTVDALTSAEITAEPESPRTVLIGAGSRVVTAHGRTVEFTRVEYDLLLFFARNPRRVFTRPQLLQIVWGLSHAGERTVDVHIRRLRAKLGDVPLVTTVRGVGYRLADDADLRVLDR